MLPFLLTMLFMDVLVNSQISPPNPSNPSPISLLSLEQSISNIQQQQSHAYQSFEMRKGIAVATYNHFRALDSTKQLPLLVLFSETQDSRPTSLEECKSQCRLNESCFAFTYYDHTVYDEASGYLPFLGESVSSSYFDESNHLNNDFWCKLYPKNKFPLSEKELLATVQDDCCQTGVLIRTEPSPPSSLPPPLLPSTTKNPSSSALRWSQHQLAKVPAGPLPFLLPTCPFCQKHKKLPKTSLTWGWASPIPFLFSFGIGHPTILFLPPIRDLSSTIQSFKLK